MPCPALTPPPTTARVGIAPRRKPYEGPMTVIPYDPRHDRRITTATAAVELWLASHTTVPWIAWHQDQTIAEALGRADRTVQLHLQHLKSVGRIEIRRGLRNLRAWIRLEGARYGLTDADIPRAFPKSSRAIILLRRLTLAPGCTDDSIGSLPGLVVDDAPEPSSAVHALAMDCDSGAPLPEVHALAIHCEMISQSTAAPIVLKDCIFQSKTSLRGDDERSGDLGNMDPQAEPDEARRKILEEIQANPRVSFFRHHLKTYDSEKLNPPVVAPPRPVAPPLPPIAIAPTSAPQNRSTGRLSGPRADAAIRIVEAVVSGEVEPEDGAHQLAELVQDTKGITIRTYHRGLAALADGRATLDEGKALVRDVSEPGCKSPNHILSQELAVFARRAKKPAAGQPTKVPGDGLPKAITPIRTV